MTYVKLAILGVGLVFTVIAACFLYAQWGVVQTPQTVSLAELEQGGSPQGRYIRIEEYTARADYGFVRQLERRDSGAVFNTEYFYPIVSPDNPAAEGEEVPLEQFAVLVRRMNMPKNSDDSWRLPTGPLEGTVAIGFDALEGDEVDLVRTAFPQTDVDNVIVLIPNQKPWISLGSWIWLIFGVVVTLIGAASFLHSSEE